MTTGNISAQATISSAVPVDLNDLPRVHPGGIVLDRCFRRQVGRRDRAIIAAEYTDDKYTHALAFAERTGAQVDPFDVRMFEFGHAPGSDWCFSEGGRLYRAPLADIQSRFDAILVNRLTAAAHGCRSIIELGCGYGYNLYSMSRGLPNQALLGGDIAPTAVHLAECLYGRDGAVRVTNFDYYAEKYALFDDAEDPILVFTCHSIEQIPTAVGILDALTREAKRIARVVHFEPVYECHDETLLGRLRRAYADSVDYNRDLLGVLEASSAVLIERVEPNLFGINPLNPTTVIEWTFR